MEWLGEAKEIYQSLAQKCSDVGFKVTFGRSGSHEGNDESTNGRLGRVEARKGNDDESYNVTLGNGEAQNVTLAYNKLQ